MAYLLDANVFISAKNLHYGFDFCPAFWQWLDVCNANGTVFSLDNDFVSQAHAGQHTIVTHDKPTSAIRNIKTPYAWIDLGIRSIAPYEMPRNERVRFVIGPGDAP